MIDLLNGLPIIGHVKAVVHLASGDFRNAGKAFYAASRTTAVMAGGVAGIVGGPAGMLAGATGAGFLADSIATVATGSAQGILDGANDIIIDVSRGHVPVKSVFKTGLYVGADVISGLGGTTLSSITNTIFIAKETVIELVKPACQVVAIGSLTRNLAESIESDNAPRSFYSHSERQKSSPPTKKPRSKKSEGTTNSSTTSGSGSQPPKDNNPTYKKEQALDQNDSHMTVFLKIFNVLYLEDITVGGMHIFVDLKTGQKKSLKKLINQLRMNGCLVRVIETVRNLFNKMNPQDVSFQNFLSLTQFVATYLGERAAHRAEYQIASSNDYRLRTSYDARRQNNVDLAANEIIAPGEYNILTAFKQLYSQISTFTCVPSFRNVFSAIYHYYKHRAIPEMDVILTVPQYFGIITSMLHKARTSKEYAELTDPAHARRELVFDRVFSAIRRRIRVVLKMQDGQLELSSCYILDVLFKNDQDSDEFIDNIKKT